MSSEIGRYSRIEHGLDSGTTGCLCCNSNCIYVPSGAQNVLKQLKAGTANIKDDVLKRQVEAFCSCLASGLVNSKIEITLPEFYLIEEADEFYLEWIFDYYRFGFDFFNNKEESGWFVLMKQDEGMFRFNSKFNDDYRKAVDYALAVIARES